MENSQNDQIMQTCPSFENCSSPICPLDQNQDQRNKLPKEEICKSNKPTRIKIGLKFKLSNFGLHKREISGILQSYESIESYIAHKYGDRVDFNQFTPMLQK